MENQIKQISQKVSDLQLSSTLDELEAKVDLVLEGQNQNSEDFKKAFVVIYAHLKEENEQQKKELVKIRKELNRINQEREEKEIRKQNRANRKRLPKRDPMTFQIYQELIKVAEGPTYLNLRLRLAFCILLVTGIRINELLPLKVKKLQSLVEEYSIAIDRCKQGPSSHKAFLTKKGKKIIQDRKKDFELLFLMKDPDAYVFSPESNPDKMLSREILTKNVNKLMREVSNQLPEKPKITSHSFRIGYITQLWKDTKDIEFVKQTIGHRKLETTSAYINKLSDQERKERIDKLD